MMQILPSSIFIGLFGMHLGGLILFFFCSSETPPSSTYSLATTEEISHQEKKLDVFSSILCPTSPFLLHQVSVKLHLPDLRSQLMYYGALSRPDSECTSPILSLGIRGQTDSIRTQANLPLYLQYDNQKNQWQPVEKAPLKLILTPKEKKLEVSQEILLPNGQVIKEPHNLAFFTLAQVARPPSKHAEMLSIDGLSIDSDYLESLEAEWWGKDALYESLSQDERKKECQRILLKQANGSPYTVWLQEGDGCIYQNGRWVSVDLGNESRGKLLLYVRSLTDKEIEFEIWSPDGSQMIPLTLTKKEASADGTLPTINLVGARSRNTWIGTINGERTLLRTDDWFLINGNAIEKIEDLDRLRDYESGKIAGALLAFSGIERIDNEQKLTGVFIDPTRTKQSPIAISLFHSWDSKDSNASKQEKGSKKHKYDDDDEDNEHEYDDFTDEDSYDDE